MIKTTLTVMGLLLWWVFWWLYSLVDKPNTDIKTTEPKRQEHIVAQSTPNIQPELFVLPNTVLPNTVLPPVPEPQQEQIAEQASLDSNEPASQELPDTAPEQHANLTSSAPESVMDRVDNFNNDEPENFNNKEPEDRAENKQRKPAQKKYNTQQVYEQLVSNNALSIQIALPGSASKREALLGYLYQCAGVQLGVLNGDQVTRISPKRYVALSHWMRLAQGYLGQNEQRWLAQFKLKGQPVRLFPMEIDKALAQFISHNLVNETLASFTAQYDLQYGQLYITHIRLNERTILKQLRLSGAAC